MDSFSNAHVPPRYVAKGRFVFDTAWSNPFTGEVTSGVARETVITQYESHAEALDTARARNEAEPQTREAREEQFRASAQTLISDEQYAREERLLSLATRERLLPAWVEGIDGLDTL